MDITTHRTHADPVLPCSMDHWLEVLQLLAIRWGLTSSAYQRDLVSLQVYPPPERVERLARSFGLEVRSVKPSAASIVHRRLPMLLQLKDGGVGLVTGSDGVSLQVTFAGDEFQSTTLSFVELDGELELLFIARNARKGLSSLDPYDSEINRAWFRRIALRDLRPYIYVMLASLLANSLAMAGVVFSMQVYDRVVPAKSQNTLYVLFIGVMLAVVFDFVLRKVRTTIIDVVGKRADLEISDLVFGHALRVKNKSRPKSVGSFIAQLRDLEQVRELLTSTTVAAIADFPFFFIFLVVFAYIGGALVAVPAAALLLMIVPGLLAQGALRRNAGMAMRESSLRNAMLVEAIQGADDIKTLQAEGIFQEKWNAFNAATATAQLKLRALTTTLTSWGHAVQTSVFAAIVFFGAPMVMAGDMTTGSLVACSILGSRMMAPMGQLSQVLARLQHARIGLNGLKRIMEMPVDNPPARNRISVGRLRGGYRFTSAIFHHDETLPRPVLVLDGFRIAPGETVALLGRNGAGKSTMLHALAGMIEPTSGEALLDELALCHLDPRDLRREVCLLSQTSRLFHGTIRENVLMGAPGASQEVLFNALAMTGADEFIRQLPKGADHMIDEGGRGLSGGQQQALLLSRILIRDPAVVLLDEPTASMDEATERLFLERLAAWRRDRTVVVATHRMQVLEVAERVVALAGGRVTLDAPTSEAMAKLRKPADSSSSGSAKRRMVSLARPARASNTSVRST